MVCKHILLTRDLYAICVECVQVIRENSQQFLESLLRVWGWQNREKQSSAHRRPGLWKANGRGMEGTYIGNTSKLDNIPAKKKQKTVLCLWSRHPCMFVFVPASGSTGCIDITITGFLVFPRPSSPCTAMGMENAHAFSPCSP